MKIQFLGAYQLAALFQTRYGRHIGDKSDKTVGVFLCFSL